MKKMFVILAVVISPVFILYNTSQAKRAMPQKVEPLIFNNVKYIAKTSFDKLNYMEAWDVRTGKKLWELKVYDIVHDLGIEDDVQDVWITNLRIEEGKLIVRNEREEDYEINLKTRKVSKR